MGGAQDATVTTRFAKDFIKGNGTDRPGTEFYMGWIGAVMAWEDAIPSGIVPE